MLSTLLLSRGVPLLLGGDEVGRTQQGNNNAYCQDSEIAWWDWSSLDTGLHDFTVDLIALRHRHPALRRRTYPVDPQTIRWFTPAGTPMNASDWADAGARCISMVLSGTAEPDVGDDGQPLLGDDLALLVNAWWEPLDFTLGWAVADPFTIESDSYDPSRSGQSVTGSVSVGPRSVVLLARP
jgi:isoamylase